MTVWLVLLPLLLCRHYHTNYHSFIMCLDIWMDKPLLVKYLNQLVKEIARELEHQIA